MNDGILHLLGLCRRAGKLGMGHDAVISSIVRGKAKLCILSNDVSQRLINEITHAATFENRNVPIITLDCSMNEIQFATGSKAGVLSVNDEGFSKKIITMHTTNIGEGI